MAVICVIYIIDLHHVAETNFGNIKRPTLATQQQQQSAGTYRKETKPSICT